MFLDISIDNEVIAVEFHVSEKLDLSQHKREWKLVSNGELIQKEELKFEEEAYVLKEVLKAPLNLITKKEDLVALINELLSQELDRHQEGIDDSEEGSENQEVEPYDPKKISIRNDRWAISHTYDLIENWKEVDLTPDFQRNFVWDKKRQSQLIESLMLRIPVPAFYLAESDSGIYQVVDGVQRLTTIRDFLSNKFPLKGLEYLQDQEGKYFKENKELNQKGINREFFREIQLTQISVNIIEAKSPAKVKFDVFRRVNTGGKPLNNQEIRNCLAKPKVRKLLNELALSKEFQIATGGSVRTTRMQAQELVLRFIAFYQSRIISSEKWIYNGNMTEYLDNAIELLNKGQVVDFERIEMAFSNAMKNAAYLFGGYSFRKCLPKDLKPDARKQLINKSLFTTWSVLLSPHSHELLKTKVKPKVFARLLAKKLESDSNFLAAVSYKTNAKTYLDLAFIETWALIDENIAL